MRTTIVLDEDVAAAIAQIRAERSIGLSDAVNELARRGLAAPTERARFRQRSRELSIRIDVTDVADAIEQLEGPLAR